MTDQPSIFSNPNIQIHTTDPKDYQHPKEYKGMSAEEVVEAKRKEHADLLMNEMADTYDLEFFEHAYSYLFDYLHTHDPDLFLVFTGKKNLIEDFYFETDTDSLYYQGDCTMREILYISILDGVCAYYQYHYTEHKDALSNIEFEPFLRKLLGWSPITKSTKGLIQTLSPDELCSNRYRHLKSEEEIDYTILREGRACSEIVNYEFYLKPHYSEFASQARSKLMGFLKKQKIDYHDHQRTGVFGSISKTRSMTEICEEICMQMQEIHEKQLDPLSDRGWDLFIADKSGVAIMAK